MIACSQTNPETAFDERTTADTREGISHYDALFRQKGQFNLVKFRTGTQIFSSLLRRPSLSVFFDDVDFTASTRNNLPLVLCNLLNVSGTVRKWTVNQGKRVKFSHDRVTVKGAVQSSRFSVPLDERGAN